MIHQEAVAVEEPVAAGSSSVAPAGTDQLDLEAAEQLIQLSGGDGGDDAAGSESRSADSVKCRRGNKEKEAAVESRMRSADAGRSSVPSSGKDDGDGDRGEPDGKGAESLACSTAAGVEEKDNKKAAVVGSPRRSAAADRPRPAGKDRDGGIVYGEERKRPKFRSLADIYRETEATTGRVRTPPAAAGGGEGSADRDPSEGERRKKKKKRAAEVIPIRQDWLMDMHIN